MPELPEVQTVVSTIRPFAAGATIQGVQLSRPDFVSPAGVDLTTLLTGRRIEEVVRRGKRIIFVLDSHQRMLIHLGMTGRLTHHGCGAAPRKHTHLLLTLARSKERLELHLCDPRRFGEVRWLGDAKGDEGLGVEPLEMTLRQLAAILQGRRRPIKNLLLDQSAIAGLGNIYSDEALFIAGIHPLTPCRAITPAQIPRLVRAIRSVLRQAIAHRGSTLRDYVDAEGEKGAFQNLHNVYARAGKPCRKCGATIKRLTVAGRSSCFCSICQPLKNARFLCKSPLNRSSFAKPSILPKS